MPTTIPFPSTISSPTPNVGTYSADALNRSWHRFARTHRTAARILLGGIAIQLFFAGLGVFGITTFLPHVIIGTTVTVASISLPLLAWRGHLGATLLRRSWLLVGLMLLQGALIDAGRIVPVVSALHPVNAMLLALITYGLASREL